MATKTQLTKEQEEILESLTMKQKIAIFLTQLGEDTTARIFANLDIDLITSLSAEIARLQNVDKPIATKVLEEFFALMQSNNYIVNGGLDYAKEILFKTFGPETAQQILNRLAKELGEAKSFNFLAKVKPDQLADFIVSEHPQTIALILAHMSPVAAEAFVEEMQFMGPTKVKDIEEAQRKIVEEVQKLAEKGLVQLGEADEVIE